MQAIKVLIVHGSAAVRRTLAEVLSQDPSMDVLDCLADPNLVMQRLADTRPDAVILDADSQEPDVRETVASIRTKAARLPVLLVSTPARRSVAAALHAIEAGANDYVMKPQNSGGAEAMEYIRAELIPRIKVFHSERKAQPGVRSVHGARRHASAAPVLLTPYGPRPSSPPAQIAVIGSSTGGPQALDELLSQLEGFPVPLLIAQHMPAGFTKPLAQRLNDRCGLAVREAYSGATPQPGEAWIAPGDFHMTVSRSDGTLRLSTHQAPPENDCRPSVDMLFRSAAAVFEDRCLAVVMTGMGRDGVSGAAAIHSAGGQVLVQDEASSVVWGMPGAVAKAGFASRVVSLDNLATEIRKRVQQPVAEERVRGKPDCDIHRVGDTTGLSPDGSPNRR